MTGWNRRNAPDQSNLPPAPKPGTKYRIIGPKERGGMHVWEVYDARTGKRVGMPVFSLDHAQRRVEDLLAGRTRFFFDGRAFKRDPLT